MTPDRRQAAAPPATVDALRGGSPPPPAVRGGPASLLLGGLAGSLICGRFETALLCVGVTVAGAVAAGARRPSGGWVRVLAAAVILALLLNLYLTRGQPLPLPRVLGAAASLEGLRFGALLALRLIGAAIALHGLAAAWPGERAADELARRLAPLERLRVPVRAGRAVVGLALRFAPLLLREAKRIGALQELRAGRRARGVRERLRRHRAAVIPTLVGALERAERVALALEARHYRLRPLPPAAPGGLAWGIAGWAVAGASLLWRR